MKKGSLVFIVIEFDSLKKYQEFSEFIYSNIIIMANPNNKAPSDLKRIGVMRIGIMMSGLGGKQALFSVYDFVRFQVLTTTLIPKLHPLH